jgi:hypothetical protein
VVAATVAVEVTVTVVRAKPAETAKPEVAGFVKGLLTRGAAALDQIHVGGLRANAFLLPKKLRRRSGAGGQRYDRRENENTAHAQKMVMPEAIVKGRLGETPSK